MQCQLDAIGVRHGSELSSLSRDLLRTWERFLAPLRDQRFDLLQIGVGSGASLRTWREWFPEARLIGLDARRLGLDPPIAECTIAQGNPTDLGVLQPLLRDYRFRLIVDDGSHHPDDQVQTFQLLFPWLEADSVYICAGLDESTIFAQHEPQQHRRHEEAKGRTKGGEELKQAATLKSSQEPATNRKRPAWLAKQRTGAAWFAELGRALAASDLPNRDTPQLPMRAFIHRKATGVYLLPGCAIVTS